ncbi:hypothetical protein N9M16_04570 [Candidatus Dependentiae bacterium]|nr:hypothetical protein [Candidatus Dependentiae bacterium]
MEVICRAIPSNRSPRARAARRQRGIDCAVPSRNVDETAFKETVL